jgi:hypothetical protein
MSLINKLLISNYGDNMKKLIIMFFLINSYLSFGQEIVTINFYTGDKEMETHLNDVNVYASKDMDVFKKDLNVKFGAAMDEVNRYIYKERVPPAEVYYGYCLASSTGKSFSLVMKMRNDKNGWGTIAKDLGIKPGSKQFHALKDNTLKQINKDQINKMNKNKSNQKNNSNNQKENQKKDK